MEVSNQSLPLIYNIGPKSIFITEDVNNPYSNKLTFSIANPIQSSTYVKVINPDMLTPKDKLPEMDEQYEDYNLSWFYIWFPWGTGKGDIASTDAGANISVSPAADNREWHCVKKSNEKVGTYWTLFPKKDTVIDPQESVDFIINNIISETDAGLSFMYIQNHNIPGFNDAEVNLKIMKYHQVKINTFNPSLDVVDITTNNNEISIQYDVSYAVNVKINGEIQSSCTTGSVNQTIHGTSKFTLEVTSYGDQPVKKTKSFIVYAFKYKNSLPVGDAGNGMFQTLPLSIVNIYLNKIYIGNATANKIYQVDQKSGELDNLTYDGSIMALSSRGTRLFVVNVGINAPSSLSMYDAASGNKLITVTIDGMPPYSIVLSPDDTNLYAGDHGTGTNVTCYPVNINSNTIGNPITIPVGASPLAYSFYNNGKTLYVANYKSHSVSVIDTGTQKVVSTIDVVNNQPRAFAQTGSKLFVACSGEDQVVVIDMDSNTVIQNIQAENRPFNLLFNQNKTLLFVANFGANTVSVIDTVNMKKITDLTVGNAPCGLEVTPSGRMLYVTNYCDRSINLVDLTPETIPAVVGTPIVLSPTSTQPLIGGNPLDTTSFEVVNNYLQIFVSNEKFKSRNTGCTKEMTNPVMEMQIISVQEYAQDDSID